jgi:predicted metalloendopeptidase
VGQDATFKHLYNNNQKIVRDIITSVVLSDPSSKLSVFYNSCLRENVDIVTADSILVEKTLFAMIDNNIKSINDISFMMGVLQKYDTVLPLELSFELDPKNADILVPLLKQGGLFASSPLDIDTQEHFLSIFQRFQKYIRDKDARFMAKSVVDIEKSLAAIFSDTAARNIVEYIPVYESSDRIIDWRRFFSSFDSAFNLTAFFLGARPASIPSNLWMDSLYQSHLWCHTSLYIKQLSDVIRSHSIASWQNYFKHALLFHLVDDGAPHIDPGSHYAFHREYDSQHSLPWRRIRRFLSITDSPSTNRSSECIFQTQAYLPVILDNYFVHSELDSLSRASAKDVVEFIRTTFINIIPRLSLFRNKGFEVINYAIQKIRSTVIHIGTPDSWPIDRSDLILTPSSFYENIIRIRQYHMEQNYKLFVNHIQSRDPVTPDELFDGLLTVANGVFQHQLNAITLNAGLLRPPIFSRLYDNIAKFARLGYLVAHELAHAIDENGSHFSATGSIYSWYTLDSSVKSCLISMYSVTTPRGNSQDGKRTLQENFADTVGFIVAYEAFLSYQTTYGFPVTVDQQQEFYLAFSQLYCESLSQEEELRVLKSFSHSIGSVRVNSLVSQLSDFSSVWQCPLSFLPNPFSPCIYLTDDKK